MTKMTIFNVQRVISQKASKPDIQFSFSENPSGASHSCKVYITESVIFNVQRPITQNVIKPDIWFLSSTCHLILLYIFARLQENL